MTTLSDLKILINMLPHPVLIINQDQDIMGVNSKIQAGSLKLDTSLSQGFPLIYQNAWSTLWNKLSSTDSFAFSCQASFYGHIYRLFIQPFHKTSTDSSQCSFYCIHLFSQQDIRWKRLLLSRAWCLNGLKHDLSNRLFLLAALPQLVDYSEPAELLSDLTEDLPTTLEFFTHRLDLSFTENLNLNTSFGFSKEDQKKTLSRMLNELGTRFNWVSGRSIEINDTPLCTYLEI
jgi:hypothetical protein